ncbi:IclR family transcriptional regulator [Corynebacterium lizhenjunii]|uniref:IclR family transcriptional regulator n=1 Tax=Corynebacterium lizhenjunii TaxID=2709394 RepID=A0A7T0KF10_9CORY|nr:IclR family transcriptional regulator [Corynebacterium lizhenjunii]QPK79121.1 IclR family transcriptional regulator [Corynebacterium lizhenjunii]
MNTTPRGAIDKAFDLLNAFGSDGSTGVGVSELARRANLSKSTAFRLLATLVANGAVEKAGDLYRIGPLFFNLTRTENDVDHSDIREILTPFLSSIFERTRQTCHLGYVVGTDVFYANKLFSLRSVQAPSRIGGRVPAFCTGVGKAIIAWDEGKIDAVIAAGLPQWTPYTITDPDDLRAVLATVREDGVAYDRQEISLGLNCVAAPIFDHGHVPVAAISVSGPCVDFKPEEYKDVVKKVAAAASRAYINLRK